MANFLDTDPSILENNLKFIKNDLENDFNQIFGGENKPVDYKIVKPNPGLCIKCYKLNSEEKFFINLCQTDGIPPPEDIDENGLTAILESNEPSSYRIPMSISQPRVTKDKSDNPVDVCDIAINPTFFDKCQKELLFRDFLIALVLEALDDKYNIQIKTDNWLILKNRKIMGSLLTHRVQNRDVQNVYQSYKNPSKRLIQELNDNELNNKQQKQNFIMELNENELNKIKNKTINNENKEILVNKIKESIAISNSVIPDHKLFGVTKGGEKIEEILAEFYLPECLSASELILDIGEDCIYLESMKRGYLFNKFLEYKIDQNKIVANFDKMNKMLKIRMATVEGN